MYIPKERHSELVGKSLINQKCPSFPLSPYCTLQYNIACKQLGYCWLQKLLFIVDRVKEKQIWQASKETKNIAILGAGLMDAGIAQVGVANDTDCSR